MARTHKTIRHYIGRIIEIRRQVTPALKREVSELAAKLGRGSHRSSEHPGIKVVCSLGGSTGGQVTDWKAVSYELATRFKIPIAALDRIKTRHTHHKHQYVFGAAAWTATVTVDTTRHPKALVA